jgi:hypothetical protein
MLLLPPIWPDIRSFAILSLLALSSSPLQDCIYDPKAYEKDDTARECHGEGGEHSVMLKDLSI